MYVKMYNNPIIYAKYIPKIYIKPYVTQCIIYSGKFSTIWYYTSNLITLVIYVKKISSCYHYDYWGIKTKTVMFFVCVILKKIINTC